MTIRSQEEDGQVWPPAPSIAPPSLPLVNREAFWGKVSICAASTGIACWVGGIVLGVLFTDIPDAVMNAALVAGPACALLGLWPGMLGRRTPRGRRGLALTALALTVMGSLLFGFHYVYGHWPWFKPEVVYCGCG